MATHPTAEQIEKVLNFPDDTPVVMVNLLKFKKTADDGTGRSGAEAYGDYGREMMKIVERGGGRRLYAGRFDSMVIGPEDQEFDVVALVEYPSRKAFIEMTSTEEYREIDDKYRTKGLESQWLIATTPAEG